MCSTNVAENGRKCDYMLNFQGSKVGHVTRHAQQLFKVKSQGHKVTLRISRQKRYNSAVYGRINFKLGGNYRHGGRGV